MLLKYEVAKWRVNYMKKYFKLMIFIIFIVFSVNTYAFDYKEPDKQKHMGVTAVVSLSTYLAFRQNNMTKLQAATLSFLLSMTIAHLKEDYIDEEYNREDMEANAVGSVIGVMIPIVFTF